MTKRGASRLSGERACVPAVVLVLLGCATTVGAEPARPTSGGSRVACPWGHVADGFGTWVRCLSESEARALLTSAEPRVSAPPVAASVPRASVPSAAAAAAAPNPSPPAPAPVVAPTPVAATPAQPKPAPAPVDAAAEPPRPAPEPVFVEIGAPLAEVGSLPDAVRSLGKATDRFQECVQANQGLSAERAEVELKFLVRGRGRAEGVSVKRFKGVTEAAARCVADVVDRRYVGYPEEPIVGVTMTFSFSKKKR